MLCPVPTADRLGALQAAAGSPPTTRQPTHDSRNDRWNACSIKRAGEARVVQDAEWPLVMVSDPSSCGIARRARHVELVCGTCMAWGRGRQWGCRRLLQVARILQIQQVCKSAAIIHGDAGFPGWCSILFSCQPAGRAWSLSLDA